MNKKEQVHKKTNSLCLAGIFLALAVVLSFVESAFPPLPFLPVGVKLGSANIIVMYTLFFMGKKWAFSLSALKSLFVIFLRGPVAASLSLAGGLFSLMVIVSLQSAFKSLDKLYLSVFGAMAHNVGQLIIASVILKNGYIWYYMPILILSGILMGAVTGISLRIIMPYLAKATGHIL